MDIIPLLFEPATDFAQESDDEGALILAAVVGVTDDAVITVTSMLAPISDDGDGEFSFSIVCSYADEPERSYDVQERVAANALIPDECRAHVMPTVLNALEQLVDMVQPRSIYYVSKMPNLPPKALVKYDLITSLLESRGYTQADSGNDRFGRPFWLMRHT